MPISGPGGFSPSSTALTLVRQAAQTRQSAGADSSVAGLRTERPAVLYGGNLSHDGLNSFDAIRRILAESKADSIPGPASDAGQARLGDALSRLAASDIGVTIEVDSKRFPGAAAGALGDRNIGHIADYAGQVVTSDAEAMIKFGEMSKTSAERPEASRFSKIVHEAFQAGEVELIPASEFGIETERSHTFHFSQTGQFLGSSGETDNSAGRTTVGELYETRFIQQDDGTRIDVETGRYASYVDVGGRDYIMMIDRAAE